MKANRNTLLTAALASAVAMALVMGCVSTAPSGKQYKMTTPIAPGVATPDKLETSIGTLKLTDGFPTAETIEKIYDNLDRSGRTTGPTSSGKPWSTRRPWS